MQKWFVYCCVGGLSPECVVAGVHQNMVGHGDVQRWGNLLGRNLPQSCLPIGDAYF